MKRSKQSSRKSKKNKYGGGKPKGTTRKPTTKITKGRTVSTATRTVSPAKKKTKAINIPWKIGDCLTKKGWPIHYKIKSERTAGNQSLWVMEQFPVRQGRTSEDDFNKTEVHEKKGWIKLPRGRIPK